MWLRSMMLTLLLVCVPHSLFADELRFAYLQLTETQPNEFKVSWKVPARSNSQRLALDVIFDDQTTRLTDPLSGFVGNAHIQSWDMHRQGGLTGLTLTIPGLDINNTEALVRLEYANGRTAIERLTPANASLHVTSPPDTLEVITTFFILGVEHILKGLDHLLFVLVLLMLVRNIRTLLMTITAFTVAHSITLSLAALEVIRLPIPPVEACIALSILFVATEIIRAQQGHTGLTRKRPWIVAFCFGLLHGLGFASALGEIGLPQTDVPAALLFFNVGVEAGQLLFVVLVLTVASLIRRFPIYQNEIVQRAPVYVIGIVAAFWTIERTVSFWN